MANNWSGLAAAVQPRRFVRRSAIPELRSRDFSQELTRGFEVLLLLGLAKYAIVRTGASAFDGARSRDIPSWLHDTSARRVLRSDRLRAAHSSAGAQPGPCNLNRAHLIVQPGFLVYWRPARWELQQLNESGEISNLGLNNFNERAVLQVQACFLCRLAYGRPP